VTPFDGTRVSGGGRCQPAPMPGRPQRTHSPVSHVQATHRFMRKAAGFGGGGPLVGRAFLRVDFGIWAIRMGLHSPGFCRRPPGAASTGRGSRSRGYSRHGHMSSDGGASAENRGNAGAAPRPGRRPGAPASGSPPTPLPRIIPPAELPGARFGPAADARAKASRRSR